MLVKIAIGHIIQTATRAAHENGAERENKQQMPSWKTI
jgi:hypothetical protein